MATQRRRLTVRHDASRDQFFRDLATAHGGTAQVVAGYDYLRGALARVRRTHPAAASDAAGRAVAALAAITDELYAAAGRQ